MGHDVQRETAEILVQGMGVSPGVAVGPVFLMQADAEPVVSRRIDPLKVDEEIKRFEKAVEFTRDQILTIQNDVQARIGSYDARILDVHLMVLDDKVFVSEIRDEIVERHHNAEYAVWMVSERYADVLSGIDDEYLRERMADVKDVARRLLRHLGGCKIASLDSVPPGHIIVADNLAPSDTALLRRDIVGGFATDLGSPVSHTAIMARALEIPAVVALHDITHQVLPGETILIDGNSGIVVIRPTAERIKTYGDLMDRRHRLRLDIVSRVLGKPPATIDNVRIDLRANIDGLDDLEDVVKYGGDGIGLFRSESMFLCAGNYTPESDQAAVYRAMAERMHPHPVIVRTLDLGGDKLFSSSMAPREENPFLGCRGIRLCLEEGTAFSSQLRAMVRAADVGNLKIMYPMISDIDELLRANDLLRKAAETVASDRGGSDLPLPVGVMIETPAAALCADSIASHVDFMSIGSNDLIQYVMAADRGNDRVSYLYQPTHPAVLRLIKLTVDAGLASGVPVGICGEMAGDPVLTPLLVGLGVTEMSMVASGIPLVKAVLRAVRISEARDLAEAAIRSASGREVLEHCREWLRERVPDVYEWVG